MRATPNTPLAYWPLVACLLLAALLFTWQPSRELSAALVAAAWLGLCGLAWRRSRSAPAPTNSLLVAYASQGG